ncbi:CDP-alcohol phosphatidyltransferase family protein [Opitutus sp. ER46]|uniref:CDP-alcohol phosphatidyltransferase family protein n=1 Tax=Opitutus sp. ER46 TaxID=2161864 RepID=UPI000D2FEFA6|nr:CDP-alcohol phosphatidyltransferase family protein [Opitutus sp. ER46]PTX96625.1 hypothetical protein DB354_08180 [Opitutus sp. ER46]
METSALNLAGRGANNQRRSVDPVPTSGPAAPAYAYRCHDRSLLVPWISRGPAAWLHRQVPAGVSANALTVFGSVVMWVTAAAAWLTPPGWRETLAPVWVAGMWFYCVLDHVDGQRARAKGTSCALGEFLDHALDAWNVGLVIGVTALMGPGGPHATAAVLGLLAAASFATVATWLEQRERGAIYLGRVGPVEGVAVAGIYQLAWAWPAAANWLSDPVGLADMSRSTALLAVAAAFTLGGALLGGARLATTRARWLELCLLLLVIAWAGTEGWLDAWIAAIAITSAMASYSGRVIVSHLAHESVPAVHRAPLLFLLLIAFAEGQGLAPRHWEFVALAWLAVAAVRPWNGLGRLAAPAARGMPAVEPAEAPPVA